MVHALALLDLVARIRAARGACDRGDRVAGAAADLMADQSADDAADYGAGDVVGIFSVNDFDPVNGTDVGAPVLGLGALTLGGVALLRILLILRIRLRLVGGLIGATGECRRGGQTSGLKHG